MSAQKYKPLFNLETFLPFFSLNYSDNSIYMSTNYLSKTMRHLNKYINFNTS